MTVVALDAGESFFDATLPKLRASCAVDRRPADQNPRFHGHDALAPILL
ncbi:MAG: hypothetical protein ACLQJR_31835 [Stellaceae bacterium]